MTSDDITLVHFPIESCQKIYLWEQNIILVLGTQFTLEHNIRRRTEL